MSDTDAFDSVSPEYPARESSPDSHETSNDPLRELLQRALADAPETNTSLLPKIQQKIRLRTRGRYYRDRWSTSRHPISFILMITLLLLILSAALFLVIQPLVDPATPTLLPAPVMDPFAVEPAKPPTTRPIE